MITFLDNFVPFFHENLGVGFRNEIGFFYLWMKDSCIANKSVALAYLDETEVSHKSKP